MDKVKQKPLCIMVMGGPGSGKGTYCKKLSEEFGIIHLSIGDILREERTKNTNEGKFLNFHMEQFEKTGKLMPAQVAEQFLYLAMQKNGWEKNVYLIDGFIKAKAGYDSWLKTFSKIVDLKFVLYLECSEMTMLKRITDRTDHRVDDNKNIFNVRIETFRNCTYPCVELFETAGLVRKINTEDFMENVYAKIKSAFLEYFPDFNYY
jgi:adenylate kinase family enzyme